MKKLIIDTAIKFLKKNYYKVTSTIGLPSKTRKIVDTRTGKPTKTFISRQFNIPYGMVNFIMRDIYLSNPDFSRKELINTYIAFIQKHRPNTLFTLKTVNRYKQLLKAA